jgi:hypothetical protein
MTATGLQILPFHLKTNLTGIQQHPFQKARESSRGCSANGRTGVSKGENSANRLIFALGCLSGCVEVSLRMPLTKATPPTRYHSFPPGFPCKKGHVGAWHPGQFRGIPVHGTLGRALGRMISHKVPCLLALRPVTQFVHRPSRLEYERLTLRRDLYI